MEVSVNGLKMAAVGEIAGWLAARGEAIHRIEVNGVEYGGSLEEALREKDVREIRVASAPVSQLMAETRESVKIYLPEVAAAVLKVARLLQAGQEEEAFRLALQVVEGLELIVAALQSLLTLSADRRLQRPILALQERLAELIAAWEAADLTLVGDLLEYEIAPALADLGQALNG